MLEHEYLVKIEINPITESLGIYFGYRDHQDFKVAKPVKLVYEKIDKGGDMDVKPTLSIPFHLQSRFLKALLNAIEKQGIKPESTSKIEGLLEATKYHLEDMRKIVFDKGEK